MIFKCVCVCVWGGGGVYHVHASVCVCECVCTHTILLCISLHAVVELKEDESECKHVRLLITLLSSDLLGTHVQERASLYTVTVYTEPTLVASPPVCVCVCVRACVCVCVHVN